MKKSKFFVAAMTVFCISLASVFAQDNEVEADLSSPSFTENKVSQGVSGNAVKKVPAQKALKFENAVGLSFMAGNPQSVSPYSYGFEYQRWCSDRFGFELCAGGFWNPSSEDGLAYSVSAQFQAKLFSFSYEDVFTTLLYFWTMAGHDGYQPQKSTLNESGDKYVLTPEPFVASAILGLGFGLDFVIVEHISIPLTFGCALEFPNNAYLGFAGGLGLRFRY